MDGIRFYPKTKDLVIPEDLEMVQNVRYDVSVVNEDDTLEPTGYWVKMVGTCIKLFGQIGKTIWPLVTMSAEKSQPCVMKHVISMDKAILEWLYMKSQDLHNLDNLFDIPEFADGEHTVTVSDSDVHKEKNHINISKSSRVNIKSFEVNLDVETKDTEHVQCTVYKCKHIIVKGPVQGGKTMFMLCAAIRYMFGVTSMSSIIVLRNSEGDQVQIKNRLDEIQDELNDYLGYRGVQGRVDLAILDMNIPKTTFDRAMSGQTPKIFVLLGNQAQLGALVDRVSEAKQVKFSLFIDEADANDTGDCQRSEAVIFLKEYATNVFYVSATVLEIGLREKIESGGIYMLQEVPHYRGLETVVHKSLPHSDAKPCNKVNDIPEEKDHNLLEFLDYFERTQPCDIHFIKARHPQHCLMSIGMAKKPQHRLFDLIAERDIAVLLYNGDGVDFYHHSLMCSTIKIQYSKGLYSNSRPCGWSKGAHTFDKKVGIANVLQWMKDNGGVDRFPRIITISGKLAGRGISFTSRDYGKYLAGFKGGKYPNFIGWRLNRMYYIPSKDTKQPELLQAAGRIYCIARDNMATYIHTTDGVYEDIRKAHFVQEEFDTQGT